MAARAPATNRRVWMAAIALVIGAGASVLLSAALERREAEHFEQEFRHRAQECVAAIEREVSAGVLLVQSLAAFLGASRPIRRDSFGEFAARLLAHEPSVQALSWNPVVAAEQRDEHEAATRAEGFSSYEITEQATDGSLVPAARRPEHVVPHIIAPYRGNEAALGYDVASEPLRRDALQRARDLGEPTATAPVRLVQETGEQFGVLIFAPIYRQGARADTPSRRQESLRGYAVGVLRIGDIVHAAMSRLRPRAIEVRVVDVSSPHEEQCLHVHSPSGTPEPVPPATDTGTRFRHAAALTVGQRSWSVRCAPTAESVRDRSTPASLVALGFGLLVTLLLTGYLWRLTGLNARLSLESAQRLRSEMGLLAKAEALRQSEVRLQHALNALDGGVWDWNVQTGEVDFTPNWARMLGFEPDEVEGHVRFWEARLHPKDRDRVFEALQEHFDGRTRTYRSEHRLQKKSGEWIWVIDRGQVVARDDRGEPLRMVGTDLDITERTRIENELREHAEALAAANAALDDAMRVAQRASRTKSEFLANMSHEIRTPMTSILGFSELLAESLENSRDLEAVGAIRRNGEHLLAIINDILDLAKIEAGKMTVRARPCAVSALLSEVRTLMGVRARAKGLSLDVEMEPMPETITTDPVRLEQILINLVSNAIKFTEAGAVTLTARLTEPGSNLMQIDVLDTGIGMTGDETVALFEPFSQADASSTRAFGGTGLGLRISRQVARILGGDVVLVSTTPGGGSHFRATVATDLPVSGEMAGSPTAPAYREPPERACAGARVLLAEDGRDNQRLVCWMLEKVGAEVTVVENGELAVETVRRAADEGRPFDLVLMDMQMPVMDGYEATRRLRARGYAGAVIALTAHAMTSDRDKCLGAGCDDYVTKPIDRQRLFEAIERHRAPSPRG